eukprot:TRINITY_DN3440_c0_g1_i1.p1 TRINITY_DN3440_c0_g1~~TRINITY_DN3440_c0_g1_i1.p1  ORF type:complete len:167 (-),score=31.33 TRINITY_DN3440_c0_g1_i1:350-793(-)
MDSSTTSVSEAAPSVMQDQGKLDDLTSQAAPSVMQDQGKLDDLTSQAPEKPIMYSNFGSPDAKRSRSPRASSVPACTTDSRSMNTPTKSLLDWPSTFCDTVDLMRCVKAVAPGSDEFLAPFKKLTEQEWTARHTDAVRNWDAWNVTW